MIIKVCGLKSEQNIHDVIDCGVDMIGYNFYTKSSRYLSEPLYNFTPSVIKVGVFVNSHLDEIKKKAVLYNLDFVQLHGDENSDFVMEVKKILPVIKVFRIDHTFEESKLKEFEYCDYFLFDSATKHYGGSGYKFNWKVLDDFDIQVPFLLSGGIGPEDVSDILSIKHLFFRGVDINSKFELSPGVKDVNKVDLFVSQLRKIQNIKI